MAATQKLSTQIIFDGVLSGGYRDAFNSAGLVVRRHKPSHRLIERHLTISKLA